MHSVNTLRNLLDTLRQVHCRLAVITKLQIKVHIPLPIIFQSISTEVTYSLQVVTITTFINPLYR